MENKLDNPQPTTTAVLEILFMNKQAQSLYPNGIPEYATEGSSGLDLRAISVQDIENKVHELNEKSYELMPQSRALVKTGLKVAVATQYEMQIRSRSGLCLKHGVFVLNAPGTVDSDYRGEIMVLLANIGEKPFMINLGERICQAVVQSVIRPKIQIVTDLSNTLRQEGGFGSTGIL